MARAQRLADERISDDRIMIDERLLRFRERADAALTCERGRSASSHRGSGAAEHGVDDEARRSDREFDDALLTQERQRSDDAVQTERVRRLDAEQEGTLKRRDTDEKLSVERLRVDHDVTLLDDAREALSLAQDMESRNGEVLAMVAHDLRSPLSVISLNAGFLAEAAAGDEVRESAEEVQRAAARMQRLLTDLLDVVRIEGGALHMEVRPYDVGTLLGEVLASYRPLFEKRGLTFVVRAPSARVVGLFDYDRVVQVISNLLGNALKFTPAAGLVSLQAERRADGVELAVADSGPGITSQTLPHVFQRFWQVGDDRRGLGLGLYICEKIVSAHGGRIWVESVFGNGATFRFTVPVGAARE